MAGGDTGGGDTWRHTTVTRGDTQRRHVTHSSDVVTYSSDVVAQSRDVMTHSSDVMTHSSDVVTHSNS